jgi:hypothetical protein
MKPDPCIQDPTTLQTHGRLQASIERPRDQGLEKTTSRENRAEGPLGPRSRPRFFRQSLDDSYDSVVLRAPPPCHRVPSCLDPYRFHDETPILPSGSDT